MGRPGRKRLAVDIPEKMHEELKILAHKSFQTLSDYVKRAIAEKIVKENGEKALIKVLK
jgi:predicted DNA-binding protein